MKKMYQCYFSLFSSLFVVYWLFAPKLALARSLLPNRDWGSVQISDITDMLRSVLKDFIIPVISAVSVLMLVIGAIHYLTAYGNEEKAEKGKKTILWAIVGIVVTILAYVLVTWVWEITAGGVPGNINANIAPPY